MKSYRVVMEHTERSLELLSRMQYDLFCRSNKIVRTFLSAALVLLGVIMHDRWWGILVIAYGCYLTTSTYASANRTAHKIAEKLRASGAKFPASEYVFESDGLHIMPLGAEKDDEKQEETILPYSGIYGMGEDLQYCYIFRDSYGGYMIPKAELGDDSREFKDFVERKSGKTFVLRRVPFSRLQRLFRPKPDEPYHL